ncbi:hypothetical protein HDU87_004669 [Geranomyces variabilis]|uniref:SET domain-containing protein n=1 Tax=Geranomyces variabilis TaxID=109894 RepID=A0AAD5TNI9_9FUNG|nr:hypothetical protein HDU87_004669 [Geranomyces variabilis]
MAHISKHSSSSSTPTAAANSPSSFFAPRTYGAIALAFAVGLLAGSHALDNYNNTKTSSTAAASATSAASAVVPPEWKTRKFWPADLEAHFGIHAVPTLLIPETLRPYVDSHDITTDYGYLKNQDLYDNYARVFGPFIDTLPTRAPDERLYVQWTGDVKKFGVFSTIYIPSGTFLAEYSGLLVNHSRSTDYEWSYLSDIPDKDGHTMSLGIDAQVVGNIARFINHDDDPNADSVYVPWRNAWRVLYVSVRDIWPGEEVTVSYGANYWETRNKAAATA